MKYKKAENLKGFTLLELIVVLAIILVLAGVLFTSFAGINRDKKIQTANNNAYQVYMSVQNWLNGMEASEIIISEDSSGTLKRPDVASSSNPVMYINGYEDITGGLKFNSITNYSDDLDGGWQLNSALSPQQLDMSGYLHTADAEKLNKQSWFVCIDLKSNSVKYAIWVAEGGKINSADIVQKDKDDLRDFVNDNPNVGIGCYPMTGQIT